MKSAFGYCPQVDALNEFMTAYESLKFMALLRGLQHHQIDKEVKHIMEKTDLSKYADVRVSEYSGGTKRKLNTALAMVGSMKKKISLENLSNFSYVKTDHTSVAGVFGRANNGRRSNIQTLYVVVHTRLSKA